MGLQEINEFDGMERSSCCVVVVGCVIQTHLMLIHLVNVSKSSFADVAVFYRLIVMGVGLDAAITGTADTPEVRSRLYRAITRAHMMVIIVNEKLRGGWLEFLGHVKFTGDFDEEAEAARPRSAWRAPSLRPPEPSCLSSRRHSISGDVCCVPMCACSCGGPVLCVA